MTRRRRPTANVPMRGETPTQPIYAKAQPVIPSLLDPDVEARLLASLRAGSPRRAACAYAGVSFGTFTRWLERGRGQTRGRPATPPYVRFARLVEEAEATPEVMVAANIIARSRVDTEAAKFWLRTQRGHNWREDTSDEPRPGVEVQTNVLIIDPATHPEVIQQLLAERRAIRQVGPGAEQAEEVPEPTVRHERLNGLRSNATAD